MGQSLFQVQPGQSKTIAYKQVSYQYNKTLDGKPIGKSGYLIYLLWMDQTHFPLAPNLSFKRIASIFDSKYGRIPISDRYWNDAPSNLVRNEAGNRKPEDFEMKKKKRERKKEKREKRGSLDEKLFAGYAQLRTLGRVREESRASAGAF